MPQQYFLNKKHLNILKTKSIFKPSVSSSLGYSISYTKSFLRFNFFRGFDHGFSNSSHFSALLFLRTFCSVFLRASNKSCSSIWPVIVRTRFSVLIIQLDIRNLTPINISSLWSAQTKILTYCHKFFLCDNIADPLFQLDREGRVNS